MESVLRDLLQAAVGDPPRRVTVTAVRRGVARRRKAEWATGTAAVVLLTGLGIVLPGQLFRPAHPGGGNSSAATGAPRYYVQTVRLRPSQHVTLVRATATGKVTAKVQCPWPGSQVANGGLAPADGHTFFVACQRARGLGRQFVVAGTRIYRFQLTDSGRISRYSPVPGGDLGPGVLYRMAATPDGALVAADVYPNKDPGQRTRIEVVNTQTGARALWRNGPRGPVTSQISDLSWTRAGRELVFQAVVTCAPGGATGQCVSGAQWRYLRHASTGGELGDSKLLLLKSALTGHAQGYINDSVITPDGSALIVVALHSPGRGIPSSNDVVKVNAATGHPIRVLLHEVTGNGGLYGSFAADPSTRFLILNAGPTEGTRNGWIDHGRLTLLKPANGSNVLYETW